MPVRDCTCATSVKEKLSVTVLLDISLLSLF